MKRLWSATLWVFVLALLAKLCAVGKELLVARSYGRRDEIDAYLLALSVPIFVSSAIGGAIPPALVPGLARAGGSTKAYAATALGWILSFLFGVTVLAALAANGILPGLAMGFSPLKLELTRQLLHLMLPIIFLSGVSSACGAVLNAGGRPGWTSFAAIAVPVVPMGLLALQGERATIHAFAMATVGGFALEASLVVGAVTATKLAGIPTLTRSNDLANRAVRQYLPMLFAALLASGMKLVDQGMAASLIPGSVATLSYGSKVSTFILGLGTMVIGTLALPIFSKAAADRDWALLRRLLYQHGVILFSVGALCSIVIIILARPMLTLLFLRGEFHLDDLEQVIWVHRLYALQIPLFLVGSLAARLVFALQANQLMIAVYAVSLVTNIVMDLVLMRWLGVAGIALSTTCVYAVNLVVYAGAIRYLLRREMAPS